MSPEPTRDQVDELVRRYASQPIGRRQFFKDAAAIGISLSAAGPLLTACVRDSGESLSTERLQAHLDMDIDNMDPAFHAGHAEGNVSVNIFENLVAFKPGTFELVNELAEKWAGSGDGLRWDFELKKNIQFHGGYGELTAEDVKFSFERIAGLTEPKLDSPYQSDWSALSEVQVTGKYTGTVVLKHQYAPLMTTTVPIGAGMIVSKKAVLELGDKFGSKPIGTGPYEWVRHDRNQAVLLRKFADYGGARDYAEDPAWKEINFRVIPEDNPAEIALEAGDLHFAMLAPASVDRFRDMDDILVVDKTSLDYNWIGINVEHENLRDKNVRLAIRYGIDVPAILKAAFDGQWKHATAILPPSMPVGYWKDSPAYARDVKKAKEYLARAGAEGRQIEMAVTSSETGATTVAEVVQQNLNEVGFDVSVQVQEDGVFSQATPAANAKKQLFYTGFTSNPDPHWSVLWFDCDQVGVWNWMSWCNEKYSRLVEQGVRETSAAKRQAIYEEMQQVMDDDVVAIWVGWPTLQFGVANTVRPSFRPDGRSIAWDFRPA